MKYKSYYEHFQSPSVDRTRAAQFDELADCVSDDIRTRMMATVSILRDTNWGEVTAKSYIFSHLQYILMDAAARETARQIGLAHNALAPEAWRMK